MIADAWEALSPRCLPYAPLQYMPQMLHTAVPHEDGWDEPWMSTFDVDVNNNFEFSSSRANTEHVSHSCRMHYIQATDGTVALK